MSEDRIEVGDTVFVRVAENSEIRFVGEVLYMPFSPGDCWVIKCSLFGEIVYVQNFLFMSLRAKRNTTTPTKEG
jgi:hypothetical protein